MGYLLVTLGGGIGAVTRYMLSTMIHSVWGLGFPWGTLSVNVLGSFIIGLVMALSLDRNMVSPEVRVLLTTGFCGGLTTFSTFSYETLALLRAEQWVFAGANVLANVVVCLLVTALGMAAAHWV